MPRKTRVSQPGVPGKTDVSPQLANGAAGPVIQPAPRCIVCGDAIVPPRGHVKDGDGYVYCSQQCHVLVDGENRVVDGDEPVPPPPAPTQPVPVTKPRPPRKATRRYWSADLSFQVIALDDGRGLTQDYFLRRLASSGGSREGVYTVERLTAGRTETYTVVAAAAATTCTCEGYAQHRHCKHADGIAALRAAGKA